MGSQGSLQLFTCPAGVNNGAPARFLRSWALRCYPSDLSTLYGKAKASQAGEVVMFNGRPMPAIYTPRNSTLLELFQVTTAEERTLRTIITGDEKKRRNTLRHQAARRAAGMVLRPDLSDRPWEAAGVSRATWFRRRAEGSEAGESDTRTHVQSYAGATTAGDNHPTELDNPLSGVLSQSGTANGGPKTRVGDTQSHTSYELSQEALKRLEAFGGA